MGAARDALREYPERAPMWGLLIMACGLLAMLAGIAASLSAMTVGGGVGYLVGMVWQSVTDRRWRAGFLQAMVDSNEELISYLRNEYPDAAAAVDAEMAWPEASDRGAAQG